MTTGAALAIVASAALAAAAPAQAAGTRNPQKDCAAKKSRTLAASAQARVYGVGRKAYLCAYRSNRRLFLGNPVECESQIEVDDFRFGDGAVGFKESFCEHQPGTSTIRVVAIASLATKYKSSAATDVRFGAKFSNTTDAWTLKANGSFAWIGEATLFSSDSSPGRLVQVWKVDADNPTGTKLDEGASIAPGSLALSPLTDSSSGLAALYWKNGTTIEETSLK